MVASSFFHLHSYLSVHLAHVHIVADLSGLGCIMCPCESQMIFILECTFLPVKNQLLFAIQTKCIFPFLDHRLK